MSKVAVEKTRGDLVESLHRATIAVVDKKGTLFAKLGDADKVTYWRSAAKPLQVIPLIQRGGVEQFGFTNKELAVMCASHAAEDIHTEAVQSILNKIGLTEEYLQCGTHPPVDLEVRKRLIRNDQEETEIYNNCSGKHAGMLALAKLMETSYDNYWQTEHPVQQEMISIISKVTETPEADIKLAQDGCGVPVFGLPIHNMAYSYALFGSQEMEQELQESYRVVAQAMNTNPKMVAGTERFNSKLMEVMDGKVVAKGGAQGVFSFAVPDKGLGVTIKVDDGSNQVIAPITVEVLCQLDLITDNELEQLKKFHYQEIKNAKKDIVGQVRPAFTLNFV
ncbi:asparaginase [Natranaerobius thermophilus]|uniref:L-asparaginase II n=1 Tax=Natranaerobius thermophilus (strain ATCC BAA-1301 / DSM 18059 / JW/NM-WN-LF) TaxID=457570 RepID=B2A575_NATTJ|nr:asparaginase [Natranaerobius thermophilus]ACB83909.1 L-asparaginase II [Natranaerobius thermophilus JW/NM-WN-LF]